MKIMEDEEKEFFFYYFLKRWLFGTMKRKINGYENFKIQKLFDKMSVKKRKCICVRSLHFTTFQDYAVNISTYS